MCEALPTMHADEGRLLAWALGAAGPGEPEQRLRQLVVHGAVLTVEAAELPRPAWGPFWRAAAEPPVELDRRILRRTLARLAEDTLAVLGDQAGALLGEADRLGRATLMQSLLQTSRVLPLAFDDRCFALARQAAAGQPVSAAEVGWLSAHRAAGMQRTDLRVIEGLARLSRYLDGPGFNQNAALGGRTRRLFLKGDLTDGGLELIHTLKDETVAVVAAVFNAVDDQIGSANTGATVRLLPEDIMGLRPSLVAAVLAGRRVLVTADHGHSPFVDKGLRVGPGNTTRYMMIADGEVPPDGVMEIDLGSLGGPPERRAFAWRSGAYLGSPQVGFHGGCGLEEMVVPLAWIERDGLYADEPPWWFGRGAVVTPPAVRPAAPPLVMPLPSDPPRPRPAQLSLFDPADRAEALGLPSALLERLDTDQKAVLVLLKDNGSARASDLAQCLRKNPGRLNGLMRTLRRTLHAEGLVLFTDEVLPSGETLYRFQPMPDGRQAP